jgi:hypothetical protein
MERCAAVLPLNLPESAGFRVPALMVEVTKAGKLPGLTVP